MDKKQKLDRCIKWRTSVSNKDLVNWGCQHGLFSQLMTKEEASEAEKRWQEKAGNASPLHTMSPIITPMFGTVPSLRHWLGTVFR